MAIRRVPDVLVGLRPRKRRLLRPLPPGRLPTAMWSKESGPGAVTFADPKALITTATFSALGPYVLKLTVTTVRARTLRR